MEALFGLMLQSRCWCKHFTVTFIPTSLSIFVNKLVTLRVTKIGSFGILQIAAHSSRFVVLPFIIIIFFILLDKLVYHRLFFVFLVIYILI